MTTAANGVGLYPVIIVKTEDIIPDYESLVLQITLDQAIWF